MEKAKDNIQIVLASEKYPTIEKEIEMDAEKTENSYTLISNDDFQKAVSGNLEAVFIHILKEGLADETKDWLYLETMYISSSYSDITGCVC